MAVNNVYKLTEEGVKKCEAFIAECNAKRKEILAAKLDTAEDTNIPTVEDIESDINAFGVDEENEYFNGWGVTDNYNSDYPIGLTLGVDFVEQSETDTKESGVEITSHSMGVVHTAVEQEGGFVQ